MENTLYMLFLTAELSKSHTTKLCDSVITQKKALAHAQTETAVWCEVIKRLSTIFLLNFSLSLSVWCATLKHAIERVICSRSAVLSVDFEIQNRFYHMLQNRTVIIRHALDEDRKALEKWKSDFVAFSNIAYKHIYLKCKIFLESRLDDDIFLSHSQTARRVVVVRSSIAFFFIFTLALASLSRSLVLHLTLDRSHGHRMRVRNGERKECARLYISLQSVMRGRIRDPTWSSASFHSACCCRQKTHMCASLWNRNEEKYFSISIFTLEIPFRLSIRLLSLSSYHTI